MKEALYILGEVVHALQRERGCSSIYLYSEGKLFHDRLNAQFANMDKAIHHLEQRLETWQTKNALKNEQIKKLKPLVKLCLDLPKWRKQVIAKKIPVSDCISHYSHHLIGPMLQLMVDIALNMKNSNSTYVSTYNAFLHWKERIGLERAIGARGFVGHIFHNEEFVERISFLLSEQKNFKNTYLALANEMQKNLVLNELTGCKSCKTLNELHDALRQPDSSILFEITPEAWFDLISAKIDALHKAENHLVDSLTKENLPTRNDEAALKNSSYSMFGDYETLIRSLQLFSNISIDNLQLLLRNAQIRDFKKGKLLFLEGEPANRLYVVLKGWVKVFKGTVNGEETILQMLSGGDAILESAVFLNTSYHVSCQVVEDATLLSIPAPLLREQIKNHNDLALNLLETMSYRSQTLIKQIENARLKTADEKIGWFLLKLYLDQGRISRCIHLPYNKSLIASYLDMKRETFSRALKRMKDQGFRIENDTVVIPGIDALCNFCDKETKDICPSRRTTECPNFSSHDKSKSTDLTENLVV